MEHVPLSLASEKDSAVATQQRAEKPLFCCPQAGDAWPREATVASAKDTLLSEHSGLSFQLWKGTPSALWAALSSWKCVCSTVFLAVCLFLAQGCGSGAPKQLCWQPAGLLCTLLLPAGLP